MPRTSKPNLHTSGWWRFTYQRRVYWARTETAAWQRLADLQAGADPGREHEREPISVAALLELYRRRNGKGESARQKLGQFTTWATGLACADVDRDTLVDFATAMRAAGHEPSSIRGWLGYARSALRYGHERGWIAVVPDYPRGLPRPVYDRRGIADADLAAIFARLNTPTRERVRNALAFALAIGARPGEVCRLTWADIDLAGGTCWLRGSKTSARTGRGRTLYLTPAAREILSAFTHRTGVVFRSRLGTAYTSRGLRSTFKRAAEEALGYALGPYALRHTFAQFARGQGIGIDVLARMMGHANISTTQLYYDVDEITASAAAGLASPVPAPLRAQTPQRSRSADPESRGRARRSSAASRVAIAQECKSDRDRRRRKRGVS